MPRKKIVFVIVEGPSDEQALGVTLSNVYDRNLVHIHVTRGDITTQSKVNADNIIAHIGKMINKYIRDNHFRKADFQRIIHIVDMDGAYIPDDQIILDNTAEKPQYSTTCIKTNNKAAIEKRNKQKRDNINRICSVNTIGGIPYQVFYMSCNLDHVLYNKLGSSDEEKEADSYRFAKYYKNNISGFCSFISSSNFSVMTGYKESWKYIKEGLHSLERHSNLGLCIIEEVVSK